MFVAFGLLALVIAAIGLYSVIAYNVAQRTHEMGVRVALGAQARDVVRMVVTEGYKLGATGIVLGAATMLFVGKWMKPLLYDESPRDPAVFVGVTLVLLGVTVAASWIPARRASHVDPEHRASVRLGDVRTPARGSLRCPNFVRTLANRQPRLSLSRRQTNPSHLDRMSLKPSRKAAQCRKIRRAVHGAGRASFFSRALLPPDRQRGRRLRQVSRARPRGDACKGPTGCGKTRSSSNTCAWRLQRPLVMIACHDDLSASDLTGRYLIHSDETHWVDGPLTTAVRMGAICYLDEVVEARQDTVVVIHPLTDDRRILPIEKTGELLHAADGFQLVISYNPGYQHAIKDLKPSTRQRFVTLDFDYPSAGNETEIVARESGVKKSTAQTLVELARRVRRLKEQGLAEGAGHTAPRVDRTADCRRSLARVRRCQSALVGPLTDEIPICSRRFPISSRR